MEIDDTLLQEGFYNANEAADLLRMSPHNVRRLVREGRLAGFRRGTDGGLLIPRRSVAALLQPAAQVRAERRIGGAW